MSKHVKKMNDSKMFTDIKFGLIKFKPGNYWSKLKNKYYYSDDIANIVWENEDFTVPMEQMNIYELLRYVKKFPGDQKSHRNAIQRFNNDRFALKEYVGLDKWNGVIFIDLDLDSCPKYMKLKNEERNKFYDNIDYFLQNECPDNYCYIEKSSSGVGIHAMFYFDCPRTEEDYDKCAKFVYELFERKIDLESWKVIKEAWDDVYKRPYQKLYLTGNEAKIYNCSGECDLSGIKVPTKEDKEVDINIKDIDYCKPKNKWDIDYNDRLYILTALKKYVGDKDKCRSLWNKFCEDINLYRDYSVKKFRAEFDKGWDSIDAQTGHLNILKKYNFKFDETKLYIYLKDTEYLGNVTEDIINFCENGINLLVAPTGSGKTEGWKSLNDKISSDMVEFATHKPILIIEPMNSIINNKYDSLKTNIVVGSKKIRCQDVYEFNVTNYNHVVAQGYDKIEVRDNVEEFFGQFELIIVDESHIMLKDEFRSEVLIPFMQTLNKINNTKVIIQTATPVFEQAVFNIKKTIIVNKRDKRDIKIIYRYDEGKFDVLKLGELINYYKKNNRKVYVYWKNGSLNEMKKLRRYGLVDVIYHKRNSDDEEMTRIDREHVLGEKNVMISSVYFGVGNDLNDEIDKAAVIIVGDNIWGEDIQAIGRWRNAKDIEVCIVLKNNEKERYEMEKDYRPDFGRMLSAERRRETKLYEDKLNYDKSIIIRNKIYKIVDKSYIKYLSVMVVSNNYCLNFNIKNEQFKKYGFRVKDNIKKLEINEDDLEKRKEWNEKIKYIRNKAIKDMLDGKFDWKELNKDATMERIGRIIYKLKMKDLLKDCETKKFIKSKILKYGTFLKYFDAENYDRASYAELYAILWTIDMLNKDNKKGEEKVMLEKYKVDRKNYIKLCGYLIWMLYRDDKEQMTLVSGNYFKEFVKSVDDLMDIEPVLLRRLYNRRDCDENYYKFVGEFLGQEMEAERKKNINNWEDIYKLIKRINVEDKVLSKIVDNVLNLIVRGKAGGETIKKKMDIMRKIGSDKGKAFKKCIISENMPLRMLRKYKLEVGQEFKSREEFAKKINVNAKTISMWRKNNWIIS